jgi:hypothetical protein
VSSPDHAATVPAPRAGDEELRRQLRFERWVFVRELLIVLAIALAIVLHAVL